MWLFELNGNTHSGLKIELDPDPRVIIGANNSHRVVIPLGATLTRLLASDRHDRAGLLRIKRADLKEQIGGFVLTQQSEQEAKLDGRALVAVDFPLFDPEEGEWLEYRAINYGRGKQPHTRRAMPQVLNDRLLVFSPEDGVEVRYMSRVAPQTMKVKWDGRVLGCWRAHPEETLTV